MDCVLEGHGYQLDNDLREGHRKGKTELRLVVRQSPIEELDCGGGCTERQYAADSKHDHEEKH